MGPETEDAAAQTKRRKRTWRPKTRTGCITCRIRRVKCDEAKPYCDRCTSTGRKCDGYTSSPISRKSQSPPASHEIVAVAKCLPILVRMPGSSFESIEEQESFHFFQNYAVIELSGFFHSDFWQRELLQAAQIKPAIRYGITALGAMYRRYIAGDSSNVPDDSSDKHLRFALQQSNRAIEEIVSSSANRSKSDLIAVMTCCILFNNLACLQGHQKDALDHLRGGLKLLNEFDNTAANCTGSDFATEFPISVESLRNVFVMFDTQARGIMSEGDNLNWVPQPRRSDLLSSYINTTSAFSSPSSAQLYLESTFNDILTFLQDLSARPIAEMGDVQGTSQRLQHQARVGAKMLDDLLVARSSCVGTRNDQQMCQSEKTMHKTQKASALRLIQTMINIFSKALVMNEFEAWAELDLEKIPSPEFHDEKDYDLLLELSARLLEPQSAANQTQGQGTRRPVFTPSSGVVVALWLVASRAPDYNVRRKAIKMLLDNPRREGVWDGPLAGKIAFETMELEVQNARERLGLLPTDPELIVTHATQVPTDLWMRDIGISYTGLREAVVEYRTIGNIMKMERGIIRDISW